MYGTRFCDIFAGGVVIVTDLEDFESIERAYEVGATDFLTKPFNWQVLIHQVRYLLRAQQGAFV